MKFPDWFFNIILVVYLIFLLRLLEATPICGVNLGMAEVTTSREFINSALTETNLERANHGVPLLTLNEELNKISQYWVNRLAYFHHKMIHTKTAHEWSGAGELECGENIYYFSSTSKTLAVKDGTIPTRAWYDEIVDYDYTTGHSKNQNQIGHFTQSVWKDSKEVGFAWAMNKDDGKNFVVATYHPPGNWQGEYQQNVLPALGTLAKIKVEYATINPTAPASQTQPASANQQPAASSVQTQNNLNPSTASIPAQPAAPAVPDQNQNNLIPSTAAIPASGNGNNMAFQPPAQTQTQAGRGLPPCTLPRPYRGKWKHTGKKRVCNRALNNRMKP